MSSAPPRWVHTHRIQATLRDTDGLGHVNNAVYLSWFEEVRTSYVIDRMGFRDLREVDFVLGSTEIFFRAPVYAFDWVVMRCAPVRIGRSSWDLAYEGRAEADDRLVVEGRSTQVQFDYELRTSKPVSDRWRAVLEADLP